MAGSKPGHDVLKDIAVSRLAQGLSSAGRPLANAEFAMTTN
jgi:hypothetical protein